MFSKKIVHICNILLVLIGCMLVLSGCRQKDDVFSFFTTNLTEENVTVVKRENAEETESTETVQPEENTEAFSPLPQVPVNTQALTIPYICEDDIDPLRAMHRCVSDGETIFLAYNEADLYVMPIGAGEHHPANIENPDRLHVSSVTVDTHGRIHLLMAGQDYDKWYIWRLDEEYQVDNVIDISEYFETKYIPNWFLVDKENAYYLQWPNDRKGIILNEKGELRHKTSPEVLGTGWILEAAVGRDGYVYLLCDNEDGTKSLGQLDMEAGTVKMDAATLSLPEGEIVSTMYAGTDTNLLLYSPYSGIWAYDGEKEILENRVVLSDLGYEKDMEYWPLTFLPDGRLFAFGRTITNPAEGNVERLMKYIPAGR